MNIENKSNNSAEAQQTSKSGNNPIIESETADSKDLKPLTKAKKRRLRKNKKNSNLLSISNSQSLIESNSESVVLSIGNSSDNISSDAKEIKPKSSKSKNVEKSGTEKSNSSTKLINASCSGNRSKSPRSDNNLNSEQCGQPESQNCKNQTKAVSKSNASNDSKKAKKLKENQGSNSTAKQVKNALISSEPRIDKNLSLEGASAIAGRLAIVEKLFDSPAFSHIVDRIQVETDTRQEKSNISDSPTGDTRQEKSNISDSPTGDTRQEKSNISDSPTGDTRQEKSNISDSPTGDTRQEKSNISDSPTGDTRQEKSNISDSSTGDRKPVSSEPKESQLKQKTAGNMNAKSREDVMAEREAKKAAKAAAKAARSKPKSADANAPVVVDGVNKPAQCADIVGKAMKKSTSQNETTATVEATKSQVHQEITSSNNRVSDVVDGTTLHHKRNLVQLINNQEAEPKKDISLQIDEVKKSLPSTEKSKAELKAERRAKQEAQRAAKAGAKTADPVHAKKTEDAAKKQESLIVQQATIKDKVDRVQESNVPTSEGQYMIKLFSHLRLNKERLKEDYANLHPAIIKLGIQYESRIVCGSNARCVALLYAFKKMLSDYSTPSKQEFSRGLESVLARSMAYIDQCRPASVSMVNAVRHIKRHLTQIPNTLSDLQAKQKLYDVIDTYVREQIDVAGEAISNTVQKKITNGDVILTYGCSSLVRRILTESHKSGTKFSVIVADGAPWFEGRDMLKRLVKEGLHCSYMPISATSFVMREASKVVVGAHALLANGCVVSRAGTSQLALLARSYNVAVLVCCETHKFSERVQTDAFVYNELGDEREQKEKRLSLAYDLTPPDLVTAVVTEVGILPCTSVPVILRIKPSESVV